MINVDLTVKSKKWLAEKSIENFVKKTCKELILLTDLKKVLKNDFELEVSILLVCDAQIKKINQKFRDKNKPTNVLSFPALDEELIRQIGLTKLLKSQPHAFLGDIIISYETIKKEAKAQEKTLHQHLTHMILHSILHLIGFDHENDNMAKTMETLEIKILKKLGIKNPYIN